MLSMGYFKHGVICLFLFFGSIQVSQANSNKLGSFDFQAFRLQSSIGSTSFRDTQISTFNSYLGVSWQMAPHFLGYFEFGDLQMQRGLVWTQAPESNDYGVRRAYLEYQSKQIGTRIGLMGNAFEGRGLANSSQSFVSYQVYEMNLWRKQNIGFEMFWEHQSWSSRLQLYQVDQQNPSVGSSPWVSGAFRYAPAKAMGIEVSALSGYLAPDRLVASKVSELGMSILPDLAPEIRIGKVSLFKDDGQSRYLFEWAKGDISQLSFWSSFAWSLIDIHQALFQNGGLYARFDQWLPDSGNSSQAFSRSDLGFYFKSISAPTSWQVFARTLKYPSQGVLIHPAQRSDLNQIWLFFVLQSQ